MADDVINATAGSILGFLATFGPMTGWDIEKMVDVSIGNFWNVTRSQIYRELRDLSARGLVSEGKPGPRDRTPFRLTKAGRTVLRKWLSEEPGSDIIRHRLLLTVFFSDHLDAGRLADILAEQRSKHEHTLAGYRELQKDLEAGGPMAATLDFGIRYERMILEWIDSLAAP